MDLTAEALADTVKALRSNAPVGGERRKQPRVGMRARASIKLTAGTLLPVWVRDVSAGGIALLAHAPVPQGSSAVLHLPTARGDTEEVTCIVRHCRQVGTGLHAWGCQFLNYSPRRPGLSAQPNPHVRPGAWVQ